MAEQDQSTPERELLKIIENKKEHASLTNKKYVRKGFSLFSLGALKGRVAFLQNFFKRLSSGRLRLDIRVVNKVLLVTVVLVFTLLGVNVFDSIMGLEGKVEASFQIDEKGHEFTFPEGSRLKQRSFYLEKARKRDMFAMAEEKVIAEIKQEQEKPKIKEVVTKTAHLKLVGIAWSGDPDAMIEDSNAKKTFFVKRGEYINEVKVEAIFKEKVTLSYQGEEVELK